MDNLSNNSKMLSLAGLCRRAGGIVPGADASVREMRGARKPRLVVLSRDVSDRTAKQIKDKGLFYGVSVFVSPYSADETGRALGSRSPISAFAATGKGPAVSLEKAARSECVLWELKSDGSGNISAEK